MKATIAVLSILVTTVVLGACRSPRRHVLCTIVSGDAPEHPAALRGGGYTIVPFMDRRTGTIGVRLFDHDNYPLYIDERQIDAAIRVGEREPEDVGLRGEGYATMLGSLHSEGYEAPSGATVFRKQFAWVREPHTAQLTVWVPMPDGYTYEAIFTCSADGPAAEGLGAP